MGRRSWMTVLAAILWLGASVGVTAERPIVYTVNYPLQYFAQRIAGEHAEVVLPVPADVDPAFWQPDAAAIGGFQRADLILLNGAGYAKWISRVSLPRRKLVDTSAGFSDSYIETEGGVTHRHGREGDHSHTGTAFTTWLDFSQAVEQARAVRDALSRLMPERKGTVAGNFLALERDLLDLDARLKAIVARDPARPLMASHPVYQYLARRYSINLKSVMWEPEEMPNDQQWQQLRLAHESFPADWMLWERRPLAEIARQLDTIGIDIAVFDPCANRPARGDLLSVMQDNIANLRQAYTN